MGPVRWGIVGCGWVARDYAIPGIADSGNGTVAALCDPDPAAMGRVGGDAARYRDLDAFLAHPGLEAVYVATPNHLHAPVVRACAAAGKAVLCEKPMATNGAEAASMVAACAKAGVPFAMAFDQRFHAAHRMLRRLVEGGDLGTVTQARIHYACWLPPDWTPDSNPHDNWRCDPGRAGGGALWDLAPHGLDLLEMLLGTEWEVLHALLQRRVHAYPVDDGAILSGRFRDGTLGVLQVSYNCPDTYPRRVLELVGTRAMAILNDTMGQTPGGSVTLVDAATGQRRTLPLEDHHSPFRVQAEAFAAALRQGTPFPFPPERDLRLFRLMEAACR